MLLLVVPWAWRLNLDQNKVDAEFDDLLNQQEELRIVVAVAVAVWVWSN